MPVSLDLTVACLCGHTTGRHRMLYDLIQECLEPGCRCCEFVCRACGEIAGLHLRTCSHGPRHKFDRPAITPGPAQAIAPKRRWLRL